MGARSSGIEKKFERSSGDGGASPDAVSSKLLMTVGCSCCVCVCAALVFVLMMMRMLVVS